MDLILDFMKKYQKVLILTLIMIILLFVGTNVTKGQKKSLTNVDNKIAQLKSQMAMKKNASDEGGLDALDGSTVGETVDAERIAEDEKILEDFCKKAFTFKSVDEYTLVRKNLFSEYDLSPNFDFFRYFYQVVSEEEIGSRYEYVPVKDGKYQMTFKSRTSYVSYMRGSEYTYVSDVVVTDADKKEYHLTLVCTLNGDGEITGLDGYPSN